MPLISRREVLRKTSLSQATLWRKERAGEFPKAVKISANRVAYDDDAVEAWIQFVLSATSSEVLPDAPEGSDALVQADVVPIPRRGQAYPLDQNDTRRTPVVNDDKSVK